MGIIQAYKMAIKSIIGNKIRSLLTMLGVIIGVGAVIAAVAFAQASTKNVTDSIQSLGTNMISINITGRNSNRNVSFEDLQEFSAANSNEVTAIAPQVSGSYTVKSGVKSRSTSVIGTTPDYSIIRSRSIQSGRYLSQIDVDYRQKVAVVGTAVINDIFLGANPIGQFVKINGENFKVIGVLEEKANGQDQSDDDQIIIPVSAAQRLMRSAVIRNFSIQATTAEAVDVVMTKVNELLTKIYKNTSSFKVFNQAQMLSTLNSVTGSMMMILGGIATISLVVGGIGIMNIMLVSVTERTREIGIRKAIGAKKKNIMIQFLIEALMVTGMGGVIGVALGVGIIKFVISGVFKYPAVYSLPWIAVSFGVSLLVGVIFGLFPAYKAANLSPIEALRFE